MSEITKEDIINALPSQMNRGITTEVVDNINKVLTDETFREAFRDNMVSYSKVLSEGKYKIESYVNAVIYVSHRVMGYNNIDAYAKTFPDKFNDWIAQGKSTNVISGHVSMYNKSKLVTAIYSQAMVPVHILNQDKFQEAINHQFYLMKNAASEKVQSDAANSLMIHLKPPEDKNINLNVGVQETDTIKELHATMMKMAEHQVVGIQGSKWTAKDVAEAKIIEAVVEDVD